MAMKKKPKTINVAGFDLPIGTFDAFVQLVDATQAVTEADREMRRVERMHDFARQEARKAREFEDALTKRLRDALDKHGLELTSAEIDFVLRCVRLRARQ